MNINTPQCESSVSGLSCQPCSVPLGYLLCICALEISIHPSSSLSLCLGISVPLTFCVSRTHACHFGLFSATSLHASAALPTLTRSQRVSPASILPPPLPSGAAGRRREGSRGGPGPTLRARSELGWKRTQHFKSIRGLRSGTEDENQGPPCINNFP